MAVQTPAPLVLNGWESCRQQEALTSREMIFLQHATGVKPRTNQLDNEQRRQ